MELRSLPREQVMAAWPDLEPLLSRIVGKDGREDVLDVAGSLLKGEYSAVIAVSDGAPVAIAIVQVVPARKGPQGIIAYCAGNGLTEWVHFVDSIVEWCKAQGCISVEGIGREGWKRVLASRDFRPVSLTLRKHL